MPPWMYSEKQPCGTSAGYKRHTRLGEKPCRPCRQAETVRSQNRYSAKRPPRPIRVEPRQPAWWCVTAGAGELEWDGQPPGEVRREMADSAGLDPWAGAA